MSSQMRGVQTAAAGMPDVKLVSFTVDPKNDTPTSWPPTPPAITPSQAAGFLCRDTGGTSGHLP